MAKLLLFIRGDPTQANWQPVLLSSPAASKVFQSLDEILLQAKLLLLISQRFKDKSQELILYHPPSY